MNNLENIVRVGHVSSVDPASRTARVVFKDKDNLLSGPLKIIQIPSSGTAQDTTLTYGVEMADAHTHPGKTEAHSHSVTSENDLPAVGAFVLCLFLPNGDGDGFILGVV